MGINQALTRHKIARASLDLFSRKGFTETSMREISAVVGINASSLYNHFKSKAAILEHLLDDYKKIANVMKPTSESLGKLTANATPADVMAGFTMYLPKDDEAYYLKLIVLLFQEQCRNSTIQDFVVDSLVQWQESFIASLLNQLVETGVLRPDIDIDFWAKAHTSINYTFMARYALGIGDTMPQYSGKNSEEMLKYLYDTIFALHGTKCQDSLTLHGL